MTKVNFPELIDEHYDIAMGQQYKSGEFRALCIRAQESGVDIIKEELDKMKIDYTGGIDDAVTGVQALSERVGFVAGFRHAIKLMMEVYS